MGAIKTKGSIWKLNSISTLDFEEAENSGYEKESLQEYIPSYRHEEGVRDAKKELIEKAVEYAKARYDLDYCKNVKDVLNYLKSLVEE